MRGRRLKRVLLTGSNSRRTSNARNDGRRILRPVPLAALPKRLLFLDLETRGGIRDFGKIELLVGGAIEYKRKAKYKVEEGKFEHWEIDQIDQLKDRLLNFDGLIVGMNLFGYDYRVLSRYFDVSPLIAKTLDFQHSLWRIGGGAVGLGHLAEQNTRRKKVPGSDMRKFWDRGDKGYVFKRNRVDCELTATLYFRFLAQGFLNASRDGISIEKGEIEDWLVVSGAMCQFSSHEYEWRIRHHNGVRGDTRFLGLPWIARNDYDPIRPALYFYAKCPECARDTLVCTPNDESVNDWLSKICCGNCESIFLPPRKGRIIRKKDGDFKEMLDRHTEFEARLQPSSRSKESPKLFDISDSGGSFDIIYGGLNWGSLVPFDVANRRKFERVEADFRRELKSNIRPNGSVNARWRKWHPDLEYWQLKWFEKGSTDNCVDSICQEGEVI